MCELMEERDVLDQKLTDAKDELQDTTFHHDELSIFSQNQYSSLHLPRSPYTSLDLTVW